MGRFAVWDDRLLAEQLRALASVELSFDLETIGFEMGEIDLRIESLDGRNNRGNVAETAIPPVSGQAVRRAGDLWVLGRHLVLCGDARDETAHRLLLGVERAGMVFADPPYNVPIDGHVSGLGKIHHREFEMAAGEMDAATFTRFLETALGHLKDGSHLVR